MVYCNFVHITLLQLLLLTTLAIFLFRDIDSTPLQSSPAVDIEHSVKILLRRPLARNFSYIRAFCAQFPPLPDDAARYAKAGLSWNRQRRRT